MVDFDSRRRFAEGSVTIVVIQMVRIERRSVDNEYVQPPVVVIIDYREATASRLNDVLLRRAAAVCI